VADEPEPARRVPPPFLDTNFVVRYLTQDPPEMAVRAAAVIDGPGTLSISSVVLAEAGFVLQSVYRLPRAQIVDGLINLVQKQNVQPHGLDRALLVQALRLCRPSARVSFADALLWAEVRVSQSGVVYSFDRQFPSEGIEVRDGAQ
jgi:predicted nucleic-acid-binding protein